MLKLVTVHAIVFKCRPLPTKKIHFLLYLKLLYIQIFIKKQIFRPSVYSLYFLLFISNT